MARSACLVIAVLAALASAAAACDTPVYRYAMYNWEPGAYRVYYFHRGEPAKEDAEADRLLDEHAAAKPVSANFVFQTVNLDQKEQFEALPDRVKDAWKAHEKEPLPRHLVFTSWGAEIHAGRLDSAAVKRLVDSPARKQITELLDKNHALVFLLLSGPDAAENKRAEETARKVIAQAAAGEIPVASSAGDAADSEGPGKGAEQAAQGEKGDKSQNSAGKTDDENGPKTPTRLQVGFIRVDRSDAAEKWLVDSLATVERDLPELAGQSMIFPIYGRGRALAPFVGKGITAENLVEAVTFLGGACSCVIKDQNPGVDLLFHWDWDATALRLQTEEDRVARESSNRRRAAMDGVGELPAATEKAVATEKAADEESESGLGGHGTLIGGRALPGMRIGGKVADGAQAGEGTGQAADDDVVSTVPPPPPGPIAAPEPVAAAEPQVAESEATPYATRQLWRLGIGILLVAAVVVGIGHMLLRKRHDDSP